MPSQEPPVVSPSRTIRRAAGTGSDRAYCKRFAISTPRRPGVMIVPVPPGAAASPRAAAPAPERPEADAAAAGDLGGAARRARAAPERGGHRGARPCRSSPGVNTSTVYRTLDLLVEDGLLLRTDLGGDRAYYEPGPRAPPPPRHLRGLRQGPHTSTTRRSATCAPGSRRTRGTSSATARSGNGRLVADRPETMRRRGVERDRVPRAEVEAVEADLNTEPAASRSRTPCRCGASASPQGTTPLPTS